MVVGAGGAGAVVAARLAEDPGRTVLLLEAGPMPLSRADFPPELLDAGTVRGADPAHPDSWSHPALLTPGRPYSVVRGRIAGGSTTTNGAYFERPRRVDLERWTAAAPGWSYEEVLPTLRALEHDLDLGSTPLHGGDGPIPVTRAGAESSWAEAFAAAALAAGYAGEPDKNGEQPPGWGPVPRNAVNGIRVNTALAYLHPALDRLAADRTRLRCVGGATVSRVVLSGSRVRGVEVLRSGRASVVEAPEVVLCAGAFGSARILLASGIRPDAVGAGISDHPQVVLSWRPRSAVPETPGAWMAGALNLEEDGLHGEILPSTRSTATLLGGTATADDPLPLHISDHTPRRRGRLALSREATSEAGLTIEYDYLARPDDCRWMRTLVRRGMDLLESIEMRAIFGGVVDLDRATMRDDRALDAWIAGHLGTSLHACGTVPMGHSDERAAVVDGRGRVHGITGLRVADTSILPTAPTRGPAASAVLIGELVAASMRGSS